MDPVTIALLVASIVASLGGTAASIYSSNKAAKRQEEHDRDMALLGQQIEDEQFAKQNIDFNNWATEKSHMVQAGINPALMYGGMSPTTGFQQSSGAKSGNVSMRPDYDALRGLSPSSWADYHVAEENGKAMRAEAKSAAALNDQKALESIARTVEQERATAQSKRLEKLIYDTQEANLNEIRSRISYTDTLTSSVSSKTAAEIEEINSRIGINEENKKKITKEIEQIQTMIDREPAVRAQLRADAFHLRAAGELAQEEKNLTKKRGEYVDEEKKNLREERRNLEEQLKSSQIARLAREYGLQGRRPNFGGKKNTGVPSRDLEKNELAFMFALQGLGFSNKEAAAAAYYYSFGTLNDLTSEWIDAASRAASGLAAGAGVYLSKGRGGATSFSGPGKVTGNRQRTR